MEKRGEYLAFETGLPGKEIADIDLI